MALSLIQTARLDPTILQNLPNDQSVSAIPIYYTFPNTNQPSSLVPKDLPPPFLSQPPPVQGHATRDAIIAKLQRPKGGIFCARETCMSGKGTRTPGHTECTELLCRKCCREAALDAVAKGAHRPSCQERKHRIPLPELAVQASRSVSMPPTIPPAGEPLDPMLFSFPQSAVPGPTASQVRVPEAQTGNTSPEKHGQVPAQRTGQQLPMVPQDARPTRDSPCLVTPMFLPPTPTVHTPVVVNTTPTPRPAPRANHAVPIATMWQSTTPAWLEARRIARNDDDRRTNTKEAVLRSRQQKMMQVTAILWYQVDHFL